MVDAEDKKQPDLSVEELCASLKGLVASRLVVSMASHELQDFIMELNRGIDDIDTAYRAKFPQKK